MNKLAWASVRPLKALGGGVAVSFLLISCAVAQLPAPAGPGCDKSTFKIALDIGHNKTKPGATSARGITEFTYNRTLGDRVLPALQDAGFTSTFLIGESGSVMSLHRRSEIAHEQNAALFISLHHDSAQRQYFSTWMFEGHEHPYSDKFHGYSIFISMSSHFARNNLTFANDLGHALQAQGLTPSLHHAEPIQGEGRVLLNPELGVYRFDELAVLRGATMPALLLESALIVNRDQEEVIRSGLYHPKVVTAIVDAVLQYCSAQQPLPK